MKTPEKDPHTEVETTGHSWDGIEELNTPLPRWWLWTFYATIIWGLIYIAAYPALPFFGSTSNGFLGWSARSSLEADLQQHIDRHASLNNTLVDAELSNLQTGQELRQYALARGAAVFTANCSQCHGAGAGGTVGYPNLLDNDWLWGGSLESITYIINHGIRNTSDPDAQFSEMPAFGEFLEEDDITSLTQFVTQLAQAKTKELNIDENTLFVENCSGCHGQNATGNESLGAPDLTDAIWLYGADSDSVEKTITDGRFGVMPAWGQRLSEADLRAVSIYVHALGGGE
ncbi:MAG: cytochrome-c oxidase, cbb3-type subunit III [Marinovum sp.]|nr:cytochrome-c oxidase, cbb3-type subunit III [Marinovum sp.]